MNNEGTGSISSQEIAQEGIATTSWHGIIARTVLPSPDLKDTIGGKTSERGESL
ncbi:MAG: hypothetical protein KAX23_01300 [Dehalococcoidia bacterium]|nr:hypothetical protein [Chloroflexota bacterium]MCK4242164.1 hypothetical protein [Dehalococcoidia bacterium]